jgi:hypothetical protein
MSYVDKILQPGETVRHTAHIHWFIYLPPPFSRPRRWPSSCW